MDESKENLKALEEEMSALSQTKEALESKVADLREELNQVRTEDVYGLCGLPCHFGPYASPHKMCF